MPACCAQFDFLLLTVYGLAAAVFTKDITRALETAHSLKAGTAWVISPL